MFKRNVLANFFGKVWPSLLEILLSRIYLHYPDVETSTLFDPLEKKWEME